MNKDIDLNSSIDILITSENLDPTSFQSSCVGPRPVFREISNSELTNTLKEDISPAIKGWSADSLIYLPYPTRGFISIWFLEKA